MTIPEIQALRTELEVALLQAFTDFQNRSGMAVAAVHITQARITVKLELP